MLNTLDHAIALATKTHAGQKDKSNRPYILHPLRLMLQFNTESEQIVAVLHDVVEDGDVSLDDLRAQGFGEEVVAAIDCLTKRGGETYDAFIGRVSTNALATKVKMADIVDNLNVARLDRLEEADLQRVAKYHAALMTLRRRGGH